MTAVVISLRAAESDAYDPDRLRLPPDNIPATIAETVFMTSEAEGRLLSDGTGARQQQIAEALKAGVEDYLATH